MNATKKIFSGVSVTPAVLLLMLVSFTTTAQSDIQGKITDDGGKPLANVNVLLIRVRDSSVVKGAVSNTDGIYQFRGINSGAYRISSSFTGYETKYIDSVNIGDQQRTITIAPVKLFRTAAQLKEVSVTAKKPPFEQKIDRLVVNVQSSLTSAGSTALDVLEKSPGIIVDRQNNNIIMGGKEGVVLMINGKVSNMPASAIVDMLAGMNAGNIERIELITTPPSNFDAEGNAGIINIVLKTNPEFGTNGSFSVTAGYGNGEMPAASFNINHRKEKINMFGDFSISRNHMIQKWKFSRQVRYQSRVTDNFIDTDRDAVRQQFNLRAGLDYQLNNRTTLGTVLSTYDSRWSMDALNNSRYLVNENPDTTVHIFNDEVNHWRHYMGNINLQHNFKSNQRLTADIDYLYYINNNPVSYHNSFYKGTGEFAYDENVKSGKTTPIKMWVGKVDYFRQLGKKIEYEMGIKMIRSSFNNNVAVQRLQQNTWIRDGAFSADYILKENIIAAYNSFTASGKKINVKFGLRYEHTTSNLHSEKQRNIVDRKYGQLFPSLFISHQLTDKQSVNFSLSRRITRPTFNELAPWVIFLDPNTFMSGNAALQPSIANAIKGDYLLNKNVFSIEYTNEKNVIARFQPKVDAATNRQTLMSENFDSRNTFTVTMALPLTFFSWWTMQVSTIGTWQKQNMAYESAPVKLEQKNYRITASQNFTLPKEYSVELSGFYQSKSLFAFAVIKPFGALNAGVQKKLPRSKSTWRFNVTDIFNTTRIRGSIELPEHNLIMSRNMQFVWRTFRLTYSKNFGNTQVKKRNKTTGSEDEQRRVE